MLKNTGIDTQPGTSNVEKEGHIGGSFVRLFTETKPLSRDALESLLASWREGTGKRVQYLYQKVCLDLT